MKEETKLQKIVEKIKPIINEASISPEQFRYISKRVREDCKLQLPKVPKRLPDYLNPAEVYRLLEVSKRNPFDYLLIEFLIYTGLRIGEATKLQIQHIDYDNNQLKVVQGKGSKDRYVPISPNLQSKLKLYFNNRKAGYVFVKRNGRGYSTRALQKRVTNKLKECGFTKRLSTHSLRHTFACMCMARGFRLEEIQIMMGHDSRKTTEIYAKLELGSVKEKYLQLMGGQ